MKNLHLFTVIIAILLLSACALSDWLTYTNTTYQFQFQYPPGGSIVTDTPLAARIQLPITPGTTLVEKYVDVSVEQGAMPCLSPYSMWWSSAPVAPETHSQTIGENYWTIESGAENFSNSSFNWTGYSTSDGNYCVSLTFVLHAQYSDTALPDYDEADESSVFPLIVATFKWLSQIEPTSVASPTPTPVSTFTPTPVVINYFIPKFNANCRAGSDTSFSSKSLAMEGQSYVIDGRNLENTWLYILITPEVGCWVPQEDGSTSSDTTHVRVLFDIPTPVPPQVGVDCSQYTTPQDCAQHAECTWNRMVTPGVCENK